MKRFSGIALLAWLLIFSSGLRAAEENWVKIATEHFTILTPAGEKVAQKWALEFEEFRRGLQEVVPVSTARLRPVTVVLFRNDRGMQAYLPLEKGQPIKADGFFVRANEINTIMLSLSSKAEQTRHVIFHEAAHWHLSALDKPMPLWLAEGLAELYATFELPDARTYAFGEAVPHHLRQLRTEIFLPLSQMLGIGRDSLLYNEGTRASIFYAQSWAFVHYLFFGEGSPGPASVSRYLELLERESPPAAFRAAFGGDYAELDAKLRAYIKDGAYRKNVYQRSTTDIQRALKATQASRADLALAKGALLLGSRTPVEALPYLQQAAELMPDDPRPWELLAQIAVEARDFARARETLGKAVVAGSTSHLVYHNLAVTQLPEPSPVGLVVMPRLEDMDRAAVAYRRALQLAPTYVPSYEGLAGLIYLMPTPDAEDLVLLRRGLAQAPGNTMIETGLIAGEIRAGQASEGRVRLEQLLASHSNSSDDGVRYARRVLAEELYRADIEMIERLEKQSRFSEVVAVVDKAFERPLEPGLRRALANVRERNVDYQSISDAVGAANRGEVERAKGLLRAVVARGPEMATLVEAERLLREIGQNERGPSGARP